MFLSFEGYSQEFLGKAYYMSKSTVNMDWMKNMSPERQKYMKARMKTALEKNYILDFDSKSSYFKEEVTLDAGGSGGGGFNWMQFVTGPAQGDIFKNIQEKTYTNKRELFGKVLVTMVAWFTPEIPVSTGPAMYGGLPGLILEIGDDNRVMICTKVVLNPEEKIKLKEPNKGKVVSNSEFLIIQEDKAKEMRERYQRGGGNRGGAVRIRR